MNTREWVRRCRAWIARYRWRIALVVLLLSSGAGQIVVGPAPTPVARWGVASFALAGDAGAACAIRAVWGEDGDRRARTSLWIDVGFILAYTLLLRGLCQWAAGNMAKRSPLTGAVGRVLAAGQIVAGLCDLIENRLLWMELAGDLAPPVPQVARVFAIAKCALVGLGVAYILLSLRFLAGTDAVLAITRTIRFSLAVSLVGPLLLIFVEQSQEALRVLAEDAVPPRIRFYFGASLWTALISWYWARALLYRFHPEDETRPGGPGWAARNLPRLCAAVPLALNAVALGLATRAISPRGSLGGAKPVRTAGEDVLWAMAIGMATAAVLVTIALYWRRRGVNWAREKVYAARGRTPEALPEVKGLRWSTRLVLYLSAVPGVLFFLRFALQGTADSTWTSPLGPAAIVMLGLGLCVPIGSALTWWSEELRMPFVALLVAGAIAFSGFDLNDNHGARTVNGPSGNRLPDVRTVFPEWLSHRADRGAFGDRSSSPASYPVFFVAAEGGGVRAAYQVGYMLAALQDGNPRFAQHLFAISGVSGGSLGGAVFACLAARQAKNAPVSESGAAVDIGTEGDWSRTMDAVLARDMLSAPLASLLSPEFVQRFLPFAIPRFDRARALEAAFETAWCDATGWEDFAAPVYALGEGFATRAVPSLFINTTRVETGERLVISTLRPIGPEFSGLQSLAQLDPGLSLRLSTAVGLSARFPVITPSGYLSICRPVSATLPALIREKQRLVDGGYFENSGITTLTDILTALADGKPAGATAWHPIVLRVGFGGRVQREPRAAGPPAPCAAPIDPCPTRPRRSDGFDEALSPFRALYETRDGRSAAAYERLKLQLARIPGAKLIEFDFREEHRPLPLGWLLSAEARQILKQQSGAPWAAVPSSGVTATKNRARFQQVLDLLTSRRL